MPPESLIVGRLYTLLIPFGEKVISIVYQRYDGSTDARHFFENAVIPVGVPFTALLLTEDF